MKSLVGTASLEGLWFKTASRIEFQGLRVQRLRARLSCIQLSGIHREGRVQSRNGIWSP